jgi:hypothetical protein
MSEATLKDKTQLEGGQPHDKASKAAERKAIELGVRLVPSNDSDQPLFVNYTVVNATPGVAFIDFAFLEPAVLAALPRATKLPERIDGRLVARVALTPDTLQNLSRQLGKLLRPSGSVPE